MVGQSTGEPSGGRSHALDPHNRHNPSQPDDALRFPPRCPAVRCHIEDVEGSADSAERLGVPRNYSIAWLPVVSFALGIFPLPVQSNSLHSTSRDSLPKSNLCVFFEGSAKVPRLQVNRHNQARVIGTRA